MLADANELQERILAELEEAGEENLPALINTVTDRDGSAEELMGVMQALSALLEQGLIIMAAPDQGGTRQSDLSFERSIGAISIAPAMLNFRTDDRHWNEANRKGPPYPPPFLYVVATDQGRHMGGRVIARRGYQWWLQKK